MSTIKTHYRRVFKSDHLGSADLEDFIEKNIPLIFTIKEVRQELNVKVAGKKGNFNIAYFEEQIKPLVLNVTNSKIVKAFCNNSPFVEDWKNVRVELYIDDNVKMGSEIVGGVRIKPTQPIVLKQIPNQLILDISNANNIDDLKELYTKYSVEYPNITQLITNKKIELQNAKA